MKITKLKTDLFNKFSDYLTGTNPDEFFEVLEIQVKYNTKEQYNKNKLEREAQTLNLLLEMSRAGMPVIDSWHSMSLPELQKIFNEFKEEIKDIP